MFKKLLITLLALFAAAAFAAIDVNKATQAELETVKGIGPAISGKILDERKKSPFKDWTDMVDRVKGVGTGNAAKFSAEGLTVNGATFSGAAAPAAKPAAKAETKASATTAAATPAAAPMPAAPAASAAPTKAEMKAAAKAEKDKAKDEKKAAKAAKAADAKASDAKATKK